MSRAEAYERAEHLRAAGSPRARVLDLLPYARPHAWMLTLALLLSLLATVTQLAQPLLIRALLDTLGRGEPLAGFVAALIGLFVLGALAGAARRYLLGRTGERIVCQLREQLGAHLLRMPVTALDTQRSGDLLARVTVDTTLLREVLTGGPLLVVTGALQFLGAVVLMALLDPLLLGVALVTISGAVIIVLALSGRVRRASRAAQTSVGLLSASLDRALRAIRTVKASGAEGRETATLTGHAREAAAAGTRLAWLQALVDPVVSFAVQGSFLVVLAVGGARVVTGAMATGDLVAFLLYLLFLALPLVQVFQFTLDLQAGLVALDRMEELLAVPAEAVHDPAAPTGGVPSASGGVKAASDPRAVPAPTAPDAGAEAVPHTAAASGAPTGAAIALEDVWVRYDDERPPALAGVTFDVAPGEHVALVGPSGAGKTTVLSLLCRFVEPAAGVVRVDGAAVSDLALPVLRAAIGYVEQDSPVLGGTVRENLVYAAPEATDTAIEQVLVRVRLDGLLARLPAGLATEVGEAGVRLSGGERQRLAIARALLAAPRLLLLDEATSQLDALSEVGLRAVIDDIVAGGTTVLTIAHRLSTVAAADRLVVLDGGKVDAVGTPTEVAAVSDLYRALLAGQSMRIGTDGPDGDAGPAPPGTRA